MEILYKWPFKEFQEPGNVNIPPSPMFICSTNIYELGFKIHKDKK